MTGRQTKLKFKRRAVQVVPAAWDVPAIAHVKDLAGWLGVSEAQLYWLSNVNTRFDRSSHYRCRWIRKRSGLRLIEAPKPILKRVQRQLLHELIETIPLSPAVHGYARGRNVISYVSDHVGKSVCLKMDLKNFFPSIRAGRVYRLFERVGYEREVSRILTGLCTVATSRPVLEQLRQHGTVNQSLCQVYGQRHLPQGSPASGSLANLCAFKLDVRLTELARSLGGHYSRYADDLLFSFGGEIRRDRQRLSKMRRLANLIAVIAMEEGFDVNFRKTRIMFSSQRQSAAGVVLNERPNFCRKKFDTLKAILFNCVRFGPESQNKNKVSDFRAQLAGKIAWARQVNSKKASKLLALFNQIQW